MFHLRTFGAVFLISLTAVACASYDQRHVEYGASQLYSNSVTLNDITLAAEPYDTEGEVIEAFDENLIEKGYYPIRVLLENNSGNRILVSRESIKLTDPSGFGYRPVDASVIAEDFEDNAMAYALLGFGIFSYMSASEANEKRAADYQAKNMADTQIIPPDRSRGAFVYFKLPEGTNVSATRLSLDVEHLETNKTTRFELPLGQMYSESGSTSSASAVAAAPSNSNAPEVDRPPFDGVWTLEIADTAARNEWGRVRVVVSNGRFKASFQTNGWNGVLKGEINEFGTLMGTGTARRMGWGSGNLGLTLTTHYRSDGFEDKVIGKGRVKAVFRMSLVRVPSGG